MPSSLPPLQPASTSIHTTHVRHHIGHAQIFFIFLKLGCISFGGPAAHLVFFHQTFVKQLGWLNESEYSQLVALAQILPGPSSSQVGIGIGYICKSYWGAVCAWLGFTLPSVFLMTLLAYLGQHYIHALSSDFFHTIRLIVLAVVMFAFWQMLKTFCHQIWQYLLMMCSAFFIYTSDLALDQLIVIFFAGCIGMLWAWVFPSKKVDTQSVPLSLPRASVPAYIWLILFILPFLLVTLIHVQDSHGVLYTLTSFYTSASMVFGGGHIILPLLQQDFVHTELISPAQFDLGYALVQLMPGPLFTFASYIGSFLPLSSSIWLSALIATCTIFLPSFFLIFGCLPYWSWLMHQPQIYHAVNGINAAVIGLLLYLVVDMTNTTLHHWSDFLFVSILVILLGTRLPVVFTLIGSFILHFSFSSWLQ